MISDLYFSKSWKPWHRRYQPYRLSRSLILCMLGLAACTPDQPSSSMFTNVQVDRDCTLCTTPNDTEQIDTPDRLPQDQMISSSLMMNEDQIKSRIAAEYLQVTLPIQVGEMPEDIDTATITLRLLDITNGEVQELSTQIQELVLNANQLNQLDIQLDHALTFATPSELAHYTLHWKINLGETQLLQGSRSLYMTYDYTEVQWLGSTEVLKDKQHLIKIITANDTDTNLPTEIEITITAIRELTPTESASDTPPSETDRRYTLFEGSSQSNQGNLQLTTEELPVGDYQMNVTWQAPEGRQSYTKSIRIRRDARVLITTDKPMYQPNQDIHIRTLALNRGDLTPIAQEDLQVEIFDGKDNLVERLQLNTNDFGIASTVFKLAKEVNMGSYKIVGYLGDQIIEKEVIVDRYALPKFDIDMTLSKSVYLAGETLTAQLDLQYFFGQPLDQAQIRIQASTLDTGATLFHESTIQSNAEGLASFEIQLPEYIVGLPLEQGGGLIDLSIEVTDSAGQSRGISKTIRVAPAAFSLAVINTFGRVIPHVENQIFIRSLNAAGQGVSATHQVSLNEETFEISSDEFGFATLSWTPSADEQTLSIDSQDIEGNEAHYETNFNGDDRDAQLSVRTLQSMYNAGDELHAEIQTFGITGRVYVDVLSQGRLLQSDFLDHSDETRRMWSLSLTPDMVGSLQISVYTLNENSSLQRHSTWVHVEDANRLAIQVSTDQESYLPGETATLNFEVQDTQGVAHATALGFQIVDEAVFSLVQFRPGLEREFFRFEEELSRPRIQVGVRGLPQITADGGSLDRTENQNEAAVLFASTTQNSTYAIDYNNVRDTQSKITTLSRTLWTAFSQQFIEELKSQAQALSWTEASDVQAYVESYPLIDLWGNLIEIEVGLSLNMVSAGIDEVFGTPDDIITSHYIECDLLQQCFEGNLDEALPANGNEYDDADSRSDDNASPRIRKRFPETLWVEPALITTNEGTASVEIPLADSITTWRVSTMANRQDGSLGSTASGIRVFQDFFVDLDFPATLTRGDEYSIPIAIYNYLEEAQSVSLSIPSYSWLTVLGDSNQEIILAPGEVRGVLLPVRVEDVGLHALQVTAQGSVLSDAVERQVLVVPDGKKIETAQGGSLSVEEAQNITLNFPIDAIQNSGKILVKIFPSLVASVIEGLDSLLRMPSGCFEQTSSSTWPNVLVSRYLEASNSDATDIMVRAEEYINTGYQRLLTFEVEGGGFEWFGQSPAHEVLTAYGLLEFIDMANVRTVDANMIARTRAWLLGQQNADGGWTVSSQGLDETGQLNNPVTVTAYVAFALAAAGENGEEIQRAQVYLAQHFQEMGTYTLSLYANFMAYYQANSGETIEVFDRLSTLVDENLGDHWQTEEQTTTYGNGTPAYIETTALATHALLLSGQHMATVQNALNWLSSKRSADGSWGSTAGTVWTIKSLLLAASQSQDDESNGTISILLNNEEVSSFTVDTNTQDIVRQADLSEYITFGADTEIRLQMSGNGSMQYNVVQRYHIPWEEEEEASVFDIDVLYDRTQLAVDDTVTVNVTVSNQDILYADMVMLDLGIAPGFELVRDSLNQLQADQVIEKYESTERQLLLYIRRIEPGSPLSFSYQMIARNPIHAQAPASRVYSYYNPDVAREAESIEIDVD